VADLSDNADADAGVIICAFFCWFQMRGSFLLLCLTVCHHRSAACLLMHVSVFTCMSIYLCMRLCINEALFHVLDLEKAAVSYSMHDTVGSLTSAHIDTGPRPALTWKCKLSPFWCFTKHP
jgi:hypothetical protein